MKKLISVAVSGVFLAFLSISSVHAEWSVEDCQAKCRSYRAQNGAAKTDSNCEVNSCGAYRTRAQIAASGSRPQTNQSRRKTNDN